MFWLVVILLMLAAWWAGRAFGKTEVSSGILLPRGIFAALIILAIAFWLLSVNIK